MSLLKVRNRPFSSWNRLTNPRNRKVETLLPVVECLPSRVDPLPSLWFCPREPGPSSTDRHTPSWATQGEDSAARSRQLGVPLQGLAAMEVRLSGHFSRNGCGVGSGWVPGLLAMEVTKAAWEAIHPPRGGGGHSPDRHRESPVGCAPHPRRAAHARIPCLPGHGFPLPSKASQFRGEASVLEDLPSQPSRTPHRYGFRHGSDRNLSYAVQVGWIAPPVSLAARGLKTLFTRIARIGWRPALGSRNRQNGLSKRGASHGWRLKQERSTIPRRLTEG